MYRREMNEIVLPFPSSPITVQEEEGLGGGGAGWLLIKSFFDISRPFAVDMTTVNLLHMKIRFYLFINTMYFQLVLRLPQRPDRK